MAKRKYISKSDLVREVARINKEKAKEPNELFVQEKDGKVTVYMRAKRYKNGNKYKGSTIVNVEAKRITYPGTIKFALEQLKTNEVLGFLEDEYMFGNRTRKNDFYKKRFKKHTLNNK